MYNQDAIANQYLSYQHGSARREGLVRNTQFADTIVQHTDSFNIETRRELKEALRDLNVGASPVYHSHVHGDRSARSNMAKKRINKTGEVRMQSWRLE